MSDSDTELNLGTRSSRTSSEWTSESSSTDEHTRSPQASGGKMGAFSYVGDTHGQGADLQRVLDLLRRFEAPSRFPVSDLQIFLGPDTH